MWKRKDNLTDLVEQIPKVDTTPATDGEKDQQVVNAVGDVVTLGQKDRPPVANNTHRSSLELSPAERVMKVVREGVDRFLSRNEQNKDW